MSLGKLDCCHWTTHCHFASVIQNILHDISHMLLLTVSNNIGTVLSPV